MIQTSYDIVKAHGRDYDNYRKKVDTKKGEGMSLVIQLPLQNLA